jgi:hypothetical protein
MRIPAVILLALALTVASCTTTVTSGGEPVVNESIITAARLVQGADISAAGIATFLHRGVESGAIPRKVAMTYAESIGPAVQAALDTAKDAVIAANANQTSDRMMALDAALDVLVAALNRAIALANDYGATMQPAGRS